MNRLLILPVLLLTLLVGKPAYSADYKKELDATKRAEQGDADAQSNLGVMYANGRGVQKDYKTAVKWVTLAAEQGDADAQD